METPRVYLDHAATTPLSPAAREAMVAHLDDAFANPSSQHAEGRAAKDALEAARTRVAAVLGCRPREVVFTSGATEAAHIGLNGAALAHGDRSRRVVLGAVEHPAVLEVAESLAERGFEAGFVGVDDRGRVDVDRFLDAAGADAGVAALMLANHETGALMPVAQAGAVLRERGIPFLCDASLAPGRLEIRPDALAVDLLLLSGHKFNGPRGSGVLYVRRGTRLARWMRGGVQEERLRPGIENVAACVGLAAALEEACAARRTRARRYDELAVAFLKGLADLDGWTCLGPEDGRLPGLLTLELRGVEGEAAMINMDLEGFAVATGSTCALGSADPSPGLLAMGLSKRRAASTLRISVGEGTTTEHVRRAASSLCAIVSRLRALARR